MKPSRRPEVRGARNRTLTGTTLAINMGDFKGVCDDIREQLKEVARPVAQAGAQFLYDEVLRNVARNSKSGSLSRAIYQAYSADNSGPGKATYHISWRTGRGTFGEEGSKTSLPTAPHGHLLEFGYIQRYAIHIGEDGKWHTLPKAKYRGKIPPWEAAGKKRPRTRAEADEWYQPRAGGPRQIAAQPFIRPVKYKAGMAIIAAKAKFTELMGAK